MTKNGEPVVWVAQFDQTKDFSEAEKFGRLETVFNRPVWKGEKYDFFGAALAAMHNYKDGDSVLMVGDPMLCGLAMLAAADMSDDGRIKVLKWDRKAQGYYETVIDVNAFADMGR